MVFTNIREMPSPCLQLELVFSNYVQRTFSATEYRQPLYSTKIDIDWFLKFVETWKKIL